MGEFQRALYDFSVAIRIENDKGESKNQKHLGDCYSKYTYLFEVTNFT